MVRFPQTRNSSGKARDRFQMPGNYFSTIGVELHDLLRRVQILILKFSYALAVGSQPHQYEEKNNTGAEADEGATPIKI